MRVNDGERDSEQQSCASDKAGQKRSSNRATSNTLNLTIVEVDPQGEVALSLLREAALEVRQLYGAVNLPFPTNDPLGSRDVYIAAYCDSEPIGCGALREMDGMTAEVRRVYVGIAYRRQGVARAIMAHLSQQARSHGYTRLRLETGDRQPAAMRLYEHLGFHRIAPFGQHRDDPTSVCYELEL